MSRYFNTGSDKIDSRTMIRFAAVLCRKPTTDVTARECFAAVPAIRAYRNGASALEVARIFRKELLEIIE